MTNKELSQLFWLKREIEMDHSRLAELESQATSLSSPQFDGMPHAPGYSDKIARCVAEIVDLKAIIAAKQQQCLYERNRLERYIANVPDSLIRQILTLRYVDGKSWAQVAAVIGCSTTEDSVKKTCYRYLKEESCPKCPEVTC